MYTAVFKCSKKDTYVFSFPPNSFSNKNQTALNKKKPSYLKQRKAICFQKVELPSQREA